MNVTEGWLSSAAEIVFKFSGMYRYHEIISENCKGDICSERVGLIFEFYLVLPKLMKIAVVAPRMSFNRKSDYC